MRKAVIVLPTYNEAGNVEEVITKIFKQDEKSPNWEIHVIVVDSDSADKTQEIVTSLIKKHQRLHLLKTKKEGLGKAYIEGFRTALEKLNPYLIFEMDADLSHDPNNIPTFLKEIEKGADFVVGSRYIKGGSIPKDWGIHRKILSVVGNIIIRLGFMKPGITDWTGGYRAMKSWIVKAGIPVVKNYTGYIFQVAFLDFALKQHARIVETPIHFEERQYGASKINATQTIVQTLYYVLTHSSFIKFMIVGLIGFIIDFGFAYLFIHGLDVSKPISNSMSAEIAIASNFMLNNFWSFSHKRIVGGIGAYIKKFLFFNFTSSGSIIIQGVGMAVALKIFGDTTIPIILTNGIHSWIIYKIFIIALLIVPYSYFVYNKFIWKSK